MARNLLPLLCALALATPAQLPSQLKQPQAQSSDSLVGIWRLIGPLYPSSITLA